MSLIDRLRRVSVTLNASLFSMALLGAIEAQESYQPHSSLPSETREHWCAQARGGWRAANPYKSSASSPEAYGMDWEIGAGGLVLTGRITALRPGQATTTLWNFVVYWDPAQEQTVGVQYGDNPQLGNIAITLGDEFENDGRTNRSLTTSYRSDGSQFQVGHLTEVEVDQLISRSFDVGEDGQWTERGSFVWKLVDQKPACGP